MPTILSSYSDICRLLGRRLSWGRLKESLHMLGVEVEGPIGDELKLEVPHNRIDLLSTEGVARALKGFLGIEVGPPEYRVRGSGVIVKVDPSTEEIRPFIVSAIVEDVKFTDKIIVISPLQFKELCYDIKIAKPNKFAIIPLGFDLTQFLNAEIHKGELRRELNIPEDILLVGIVGRLTAIKNHVMFLKSAKKVSERIANVKFVIVGGGELESEMRELAISLEIQDKVIFLGWRYDMPTIYADIDLVVLSSLNEGTPVTLIEAMASGKAVVSTAVGGVPDIVLDGQTGILVPSGDEEKFADAIVDLLEDAEKRKQFGKRGREFVSANYTKERLCADIEHLYLDLLFAQKME